MHDATHRACIYSNSINGHQLYHLISSHIVTWYSYNWERWNSIGLSPWLRYPNHACVSPLLSCVPLRSNGGGVGSARTLWELFLSPSCGLTASCHKILWFRSLCCVSLSYCIIFLSTGQCFQIHCSSFSPTRFRLGLHGWIVYYSYAWCSMSRWHALFGGQNISRMILDSGVVPTF